MSLFFYFINVDIKLYYINKLVKKRFYFIIYYLLNDNILMFFSVLNNIYLFLSYLYYNDYNV